MFFFDIKYLLIVMLPGMLISGAASLLVRRAFNKYSQVRSRNGYTGAQAAAMLLRDAGIGDVSIVRAQGHLTDHDNPQTRELALSDGVYGSDSLAAVGIACHEAGHAIQHARNYGPLGLRSALVPMAGIGSSLGYVVMGLGLFIHPFLVGVGVLIFSGVLLFQIVTLPVEFDATARAKKLVVETGIVSSDERYGIDSVLNAAALTYVAAVITTLLTIAYYLIRSGLLGGNND
ncbi:MAG: zinc metallopeptidase [Planctomycetaceae bacterium]